ncbi:hypothetical protein [Pyxidicoccus xibeiensis]|uniref:hypothetical protein n=1 Tax=Pyxidicoccus xibeiensis TaxID=2906759 RepID=UPI0020A74C54|nr:hypothetical protein [Pyxidicoccus xibeiensis]MCP3136976.1 hypothetical protein [Pyxidicoccus xibeiensis]
MSPLDEDPSIVFPKFFSQPAQRVGASGIIHDLDGVTFQALRVAADDFLPVPSRSGACWERQAAHRYRVIREADIIFVRIDMDPAACDLKVLPLDSGVEYAISLDGRILRRRFDGEPQSATEVPDAGASIDAGEPGPVSPVGATWGEPAPDIPRAWLDGGVIHDGSTPTMPGP